MFKLSLSRGNSKTEGSNLKDLFPLQTIENFNQITIDVTVLYFGREGRDLAPEIRVALNPKNGIDVVDLLNSLKFMGYPIENNYISYYNVLSDVYVFIGKDPVPSNAMIPCQELAKVDDRYQVIIRIRQETSLPLKTLVTPYPEAVIAPAIKFEEETSNFDQYDQTMHESPSEATENPISKAKRTKERKVGQILDMVIQWRKYYNGFTDPETGQIVKMSLEASAAKLGMSKKSLDDYLLQIRFGKKCGFSFAEHLDDSVGVLRAFVKKNKHSKNENIKDAKLSDDLDLLLDKKESKTKQKRDSKSQYDIGVSTRSKKISK